MLGGCIGEENKENIWVTDSHKCVSKKPLVKTKPKRKPLTIAVEGNIGSGKSTFLQHFAKYPEVKMIPEPVALWKDIRGHNVLELMYRDPQRWSYAFQSYVQLTMLKVHCKELSKKHKVKFMERSMFSARYCFLENLYESDMIDPVHSAILDEWFKWMQENTDLNLDLIVYLKASPQTCYNRIQERQRSEENSVPLSYLETLHRLHEDWLIHEKTFKIPAPVLILDAEKDVSTLVKTFESKKAKLFDGLW